MAHIGAFLVAHVRNLHLVELGIYIVVEALHVVCRIAVGKTFCAVVFVIRDIVARVDMVAAVYGGVYQAACLDRKSVV